VHLLNFRPVLVYSHFMDSHARKCGCVLKTFEPLEFFFFFLIYYNFSHPPGFFLTKTPSSRLRPTTATLHALRSQPRTQVIPITVSRTQSRKIPIQNSPQQFQTSKPSSAISYVLSNVLFRYHQLLSLFIGCIQHHLFCLLCYRSLLDKAHASQSTKHHNRDV
jgi:hypothetical protein